MTISLVNIKSVVAAAIVVSFAVHVSAQMNERQIELLANNCMQCHGDPATTAPVFGVEEDWREVSLQPEALTLTNVIEGINGMPPLGYCSACTVEDFQEMIRFLVPSPESAR